LNLDKYIERIGYKADLSVSNDCLIDLHRCHVNTIPFEALDVQFKRGISLDICDIYKKVILNNRGGFCYELNHLFYKLLVEIGFNCSMVSSRIYDDGKYGPVFDHMSIVVKLEDEWLVDVGYGDLFIEPLNISSGQVQEDKFKDYKINDSSTGQLVLLESLKGKNKFKEKYSFDLQPRFIAEFDDQCHYKQYSPESYFVKNRVCTLPTDTGRKTIMNDVFKVKEDATVTRSIICDEDDLFRILKKEFDISI